MEEDLEPVIQAEISPADRIKPWQFKPGQSGNPSGKPKGTVSLKEYAKKMLRDMNEEEKLEYMKGMDKDFIWEMAEDKAQSKSEVKMDGNLIIKTVNYGDNTTPQVSTEAVPDSSVEIPG